MFNCYLDYYRRTEFTASGMLFWIYSRNSTSKREEKSIRSNINESIVVRSDLFYTFERFQS